MKKYLLSIVSLILGIGCLVSYTIIGSEIAADGTLIEPFYLIPISYLFFAISIVGFIIALILRNKSKKKK